MQQQNRFNQIVGTAYDALWFETLFNALDALHDDVCAGRLDPVLTVAPDEMTGWLEDIAYTAQETILEIRALAPGLLVTNAGHSS